ncbi:MAG TPA: SCO family protein [Tepidisphaeraceae bacterium]
MRRFLVLSSSGVTALALMFAVTLLAGATLAPKADRAISWQMPLVPEFSLTDQQGRVLSRHDLHGQVWLAAFFFSRCSDNCPKMNARLHQLQTALDPRVQLVSFTMDPAHDTPNALAQFAAANQIDSSRWHLLTGERRIIEQVAAAIRPDALHQRPENLTHSDQLILIDRSSRLRGTYDSTSAADLDCLRKDAAALLK